MNFPNPTRYFDGYKRCVAFQGHDAAREISFEVDVEALRVMSGGAGTGETALLAAFDAHRERIEKVAGKAWSRKKLSYIRLSEADF